MRRGRPIARTGDSRLPYVLFLTVISLNTGLAFLAALLAYGRSYGAAAILASVSLAALLFSSRMAYRLSWRSRRGTTKMDIVRDVLRS